MTKESLTLKINRTIELGKAEKALGEGMNKTKYQLCTKWYLYYKHLLEKLESAPGISKPTLGL